MSGCSKEHRVADGVWDAFIQRVLGLMNSLARPTAPPRRRGAADVVGRAAALPAAPGRTIALPRRGRAPPWIPSLVAPSMHPSIHEDGALPWMEVSDDGLTSYIRDEVPGVDTHGYDGYAEIAVPRALGSVRLTVNMPTPDDFCHGVYLRRGHQLEMDLDLGGESSNNATVAGDYCVELLASSTRRSRASAAPGQLVARGQTQLPGVEPAEQAAAELHAARRVVRGVLGGGLRRVQPLPPGVPLPPRRAGAASARSSCCSSSPGPSSTLRRSDDPHILPAFERASSQSCQLQLEIDLKSTI